MKKQLLTVGDSFTYGDELDDVYQAWPYKLAESLGHEVHNMGQSGSSNSSILRRTLEELASNSYDLVVVGWTSPGRIEWKDDIGVAYNVWPGFQSRGKFFEDHPWRQALVDYISQYHCSEYLYQQYLVQVLSLQSYCKVNDIKLLMLNVRQNDYYRSVGAEQHDNLGGQVDTDAFIGYKKFGMVEITKDCPKAPGGHPLELGHIKIAEKINEHIRNLSWLS